MNLVAAYRRMTGKTQSYFADVLGISLNSYANKENGKTQFTQQEMHLFYSELKKYISDITVEDIFFKEELQKITKNKNWFLKGGERMNQTGIPVYLPQDVQQEIYNEILALTFTAIEKAKNEMKATTNTRYLNKKGLCEYFTCAPRVVEQWQREGLKSFLKGNQIMFDLKDVHEFLEKKKF